MPRFHFNFHGAGEDAVDDLGSEFETLDLAYLDAYRSMVRIGADMLLEQKNPSLLRLDILDDAGQVLVQMPFDEVFARRMPQRGVRSSVYQDLERRVETSRRLSVEIRTACSMARAHVATARVTLDRARVSRRQPADQGW